MASPGYFEKKGDVATLKSRLRDAVTKKDSKVCHAAIKKTIQLMTLGIDVSPICPEIIMASATNDIVQKKLVYLYLCSCAESNSELALLAINTLVKDAQDDDNAMIRGLALRSMLNMRIQNLVQYARSPLKSGLNDKSCYVRRNALMAAVKLFRLDADMFHEMDLVNTIRNCIYESDHQVSYTALVALDEIESSKGGIKFDKEFASYLIARLLRYNEFSQSVILEMLTRYETNDEDDILEYMNILDDRLKHANKGVVMATIRFFLHLTKNMEWIKSDLYERIKTPMLLMLLSSTAEIAYPILCHISVFIGLKPRLFHKDYKHFFIRNNEPTYVRQKKLEILTRITTEGNMKAIVEEIREYMHDPDISISCKAIYSVGKIALENPFAKDICVDTLIDMLHLEVDYITAKCLQTLQELMMKYPSLSSDVLAEIDECWDQVQYHAIGKSAIIWIYGEHGQDIPAAPYHLEELIENISEEQSATVKLNLLTAMMKLFFKRPPECQNALGKLLKYCIDDETNMDVRDRALFYYRLISTDVEQAQAVLECTDEVMPFPPVVEKPVTPSEDFHLKEFNSLSIVYDVPSTSFITHKYHEYDQLSADTQVVETKPSPVYTASKGNKTVAVAALIDTNEERGLGLVKDFAMEKNEFQVGWKSMPFSKKFDESLTVVPECKEILTVMEAENIVLMACNRAEDAFWKFFFYAKMSDNDVVVLVETVIHHQQDRMSVVTKCKDEAALQTFTHFYKKLFVGKWIALPNR